MDGSAGTKGYATHLHTQQKPLKIGSYGCRSEPVLFSSFRTNFYPVGSEGRGERENNILEDATPQEQRMRMTTTFRFVSASLRGTVINKWRPCRTYTRRPGYTQSTPSLSNAKNPDKSRSKPGEER